MFLGLGGTGLLELYDGGKRGWRETLRREYSSG